MPSNGRTATVRSHRRGGPRRRISFGPWLIIGSVVLLVGAGVTAGYAYIINGGCSGSTEATVVVTPRLQSIMQKLSVDWAQTSPSVNGLCGKVTITAKDSSAVAGDLGAGWDAKSMGQAPDVWVPDSSAWVRKASVSAVAERIMPDLQPSLARTPTVIAMPKELATAADMTSKPLSWLEIIGKLKAAGGWGTYDHPEWGGFKVGLSDPAASTPGLLALMAISDTNDDGEVDPTEQTTLLDLKKVISVTADSTEDIFNGIRSAAGQDTKKALGYVSAFPALEQDVLNYNLDNPKVPLVAVYPQDGTAEADFPYLILDRASWVTEQRRDVAQAFLAYVRGPEGRAAFLDAGFRDPNRSPGPALVPANGVASKITALPRAVLLPESVAHASASWTAVTRPTNVLFVFDTSGSTGEIVRGTGKSKLDLTKEAAKNALTLLDGAAKVGVWNFSTVQSGQDYRKLLGLARLDEASADGDEGATHRDDVVAAIDGLTPGGNTGLYNTVWAACQEVSKQYQDKAANFVVLLTDGAEDNNVAGGLTLSQLTKNLRTTCGGSKPVQVITIGLGVSTQTAELRDISNATKAPTFASAKSFNINQVVVSFLFD